MPQTSWTHLNQLSFGLLCCSSGCWFPTKAKRVSFALSVSELINSLRGLAFVHEKTVRLSCVTRVRQHPPRSKSRSYRVQRQVSCEFSRMFTWNSLAATVGWPQRANETGVKKAAEPTMTASFQQKWQQRNGPFSQFFLHNTRTMPTVFVPASAKRKVCLGS